MYNERISSMIQLVSSVGLILEEGISRWTVKLYLNTDVDFEEQWTWRQICLSHSSLILFKPSADGNIACTDKMHNLQSQTILFKEIQMTQAGSRDIGEDFQWIRCIITFFGA